jgi:glucose-6-phosphate 1-dehydrogenase
MHSTLILFGATGDLALRYLFPSLAHLLRDRLLPADFRVVAVALQPYDEASFRAWLIERLSASQTPRELSQADLRALAERVHYVATDLSDPDSIPRALGAPCPRERAHVSYLATPPGLFTPIARGLRAAGLLDAPSRLVLEKPIGRDLASARAINGAIHELIAEDRVYRIDHYLGKATVQNLIALRFGNTLLEAVWNHRFIESVDILIAETGGVDGRDAYYGTSGALRDMVQNHMLQLLALTAMEPPGSLNADTLRDEKVKVLRALRPFDVEHVTRDSMRGCYQAGVVAGQPVPGYAPAQGEIETFVGLVAHIDNWRWAGVPFRLCTGKRLAERSTQIVVRFRPVSHWLFEKPARDDAAPNRLVMRLQPEENISLELMSSLAGPEWGALELQPLALDLSMRAHTARRRIAYERLMLDALHGNPTLFVRGDEVEAAWSWIDGVLAAWAARAQPVLPYMSGSWGPEGSEAFLPDTLRATRRKVHA